MRSLHLFCEDDLIHGDTWSMSEYSAQVNIIVLHCSVKSKMFKCTCELQAGPLWARTKVDTFFQVGPSTAWLWDMERKRQKVVAFGARKTRCWVFVAWFDRFRVLAYVQSREATTAKRKLGWTWTNGHRKSSTVQTSTNCKASKAYSIFHWFEDWRLVTHIEYHIFNIRYSDSVQAQIYKATLIWDNSMPESCRDSSYFWCPAIQGRNCLDKEQQTQALTK